MIKRITSMAVVALIAACTGTPSKEQQAATVEERTPGQQAGAKPAPGAEVTPLKPGCVGGNPLTDPATPLSKRSVFLRLRQLRDQGRVQVPDPGPRPVTEAEPPGQDHPAGQRRRARQPRVQPGPGPEARRRGEEALDVLGVKDAQVESVSFGEEKPRGTGHDEASWAENRRADRVSRRVSPVKRGAIALALGLVAGAAQAGLFDDEEARKGVEQSKKDISQLQSGVKSLDARVARIEEAVKSQSKLDLLNQIEALKQEIAKLRGQIEELKFAEESAQKRQKDFYVDLDTRLRRLEQPGAAVGRGGPGSGGGRAPRCGARRGAWSDRIIRTWAVLDLPPRAPSLAVR